MRVETGSRASRVRAAVFVGTRADLGPLSPVLTALAAADDVELLLLTGVAYGPDELAAALPGGDASAWRESVHPIAEPMSVVSAEAVLHHGPRLAAGAGEVLTRLRPDVLVVLGDRWELLYVVPPAFLGGIPVVHLHGGEVTEGAVDERVRHAISKLADQHCVASEDAARRLRQMGEPADRVHHTGAPGLDRLAAAEPLGEEELGELLGRPVQRPVALFTYHPPTAQRDAPVGRWAREALEAAREHCGTVVATHPGMDAGREAILAALAEVSAADPAVLVVEALGSRYPRVLASVDVVVGNSSSGVIEAASVGVPAVNVGERQRGRLRGANVIDAAEGRDAVSDAVAAALTPAFRATAAAVVNPYGAGDASSRILDIVRAAPGTPRVKPFVDAPDAPDAPVEDS